MPREEKQLLHEKMRKTKKQKKDRKAYLPRGVVIICKGSEVVWMESLERKSCT